MVDQIYAPAKINVFPKLPTSPSKPKQLVQPPLPIPSTQQESQHAEVDIDFLHSLSFPHVDDSDDSESDSDATVPLDLSLHPQISSAPVETGDMDPFRQALFTDRSSFSTL